MGLFSEAWRGLVRSLTPGSKRKRDVMEHQDTSTARGGSISLRGDANGTKGNERNDGSGAENRRATDANRLVTPPETILASAMFGMGSKKFKWTEHPPPRKSAGGEGIPGVSSAAGKRLDIPDVYIGSAMGDRRGVHGVGAPATTPAAGTTWTVGRPATANFTHRQSTKTSKAAAAVRKTTTTKRKKDVAHKDFYGQFFRRMQLMSEEYRPSLANIIEPVSQYNYHHGKAVLLVSKANLMMSSAHRDTTEKRQNELKEIESSISRIRELRLQPKRRDVYPYKRTLLAPKFTDAEKNDLLLLTRKPDDEAVFKHEASKVKLLGRDLRRLAPGSWLNDEIINLYMRLLQDRDTKIHERKDADDFPKCHFFNTFFLSKLYKASQGYDYNSVRRWTMPARLKATGQSRSSILDVDKIIVPVNQSNTHWTVAVMDLKNERLEYFDSLGGEDHECLEHLAQYLTDEYKNKRAEDRPDVLDWPRTFPKNIPRQRNGWDCGVFLSMYANCLSVEAELMEMNMDEYRLEMLREFQGMEVGL